MTLMNVFWTIFVGQETVSTLRDHMTATVMRGSQYLREETLVKTSTSAPVLPVVMVNVLTLMEDMSASVSLDTHLMEKHASTLMR